MHHPIQFQEMARMKQADLIRDASAYRVAQQSKPRPFTWMSGKIGRVLAGMKDEAGRIGFELEQSISGL